MAIWNVAKNAEPAAQAKSVLVIKLGALGDFIQALAPARLIRQRHLGARITLLTTEVFKDFAEKCPYFDVVEADGRPREAAATAQLLARIRAAKYDMVYDLQTSGRTTNYFRALQPKPPPWSGVAPGCAFPHTNPDRETMHSLDRLADQLVQAGFSAREVYRSGEAPLPDLSWVRPALRDPPRLQPGYFGLRGPYVLIIPGASPHRPEKRWPAKHYADLAIAIAERGVTPVVIGHLAEREVGQAVAEAEPRAKNLVTRTDFFQVAALAERAAFAVGNDTGPMHIAAASGTKCLVLFSSNSDPARVAPRSPQGVATISASHLADLPVIEVERAMRNLGAFGWSVPA
ncbi:MAG: glycosyltransferase family 9 protein [Caulobacterales bacterium]|jgi:ADP-heptose:LPS heptosyltransferase